MDSATINPSKEVIQNWLQLRIAEYLQLDADEIDVSLPFSYYGLDSVASLGISGELEIWLDRKLPQTLTWDYPNIELLSTFLAEA
jgi:acyl carrier protein